MLEQADAKQAMLSFSNTLKSAAAPLFENSPIKHLCYEQTRLKNDDFYYLCVSTDENLMRNYLYSDKVPTSPADCVFDDYIYTQNKYHLKDLDKKAKKSNPRVEMLRRHGYDHTFRVINRQNLEREQVIETFSFEGDVDDSFVNMFFLNHTDDLGHFCDFLKTQLHNYELQQASLHQKTNYKLKKELMPEMQAMINQLKLKVYCNTADYDKTKLTKRQKQVLYHFMQGKTAVETAEMLYISKRTVERHFEDLRRSLNTSNKYHTLYYALANDLI